ncbi:MAG: hypothetical protein ISS88_01010 [Candidatus Portnoybacteria bacterium]|nr:hypothetical protein [Candidatus Portnoybacteria bacterium]
MSWPTKKSGEVEKLIQPILKKYERLNLTTSPLYVELKKDLQDQEWINGVYNVFHQVENARSIFSIVSEITVQKNDQKVLEMFSEIDAAKWLIKGAIDGKYNRIVYLKKDTSGKSPDFVTYREGEILPIEVKMLSPQDVAENRFISKVIAKINDEAIHQLIEFKKKNQISRGIILFWTHQPIRLENVTYDELNQSLNQKVIKSDFPLCVFVTIYKHGIWDFYL